MMEEYIIPLNGLPAGKKSFSWHAGQEFFGRFDNADILDADLSVEVMVEKSGASIGVDCSLEGTLTVPCDRCLEDLRLPVRAEVRLRAKPGEGVPEVETEGGREVVFYSVEDGILDLSQTIYDYALLALPLQRVHEEGLCNPDAVKHLGRGSVESNKPEGQINDSPFAALKGLLGN